MSKINIVIHLTEPKREKIAFDLGSHELPDDVECKDWFEEIIEGALNDIPDDAYEG